MKTLLFFMSERRQIFRLYFRILAGVSPVILALSWAAFKFTFLKCNEHFFEINVLTFIWNHIIQQTTSKMKRLRVVS